MTVLFDWDDAAIARLTQLWAEGHSVNEIGRRMKISKNSVVGKAHRLKLPGRTSPIRRGGPRTDKSIYRAQRQGRLKAGEPGARVVPTLDELIGPAGCADATSEAVRRFERIVEQKQSGWTDNKISRLRALWDQGLPLQAIGRQLGVSEGSVIGKVNRLGLKTRNFLRRGTIENARNLDRDPKRAPKTESAVAAPIAIARRIGRVTTCCWPIGEPGARGFRFCGDPSEPGKPYCDPHCERAYVRTRSEAAHAA